MKIVADENIPLVEEFFSDLGRVYKHPGRTLSPGDLGDAQMLLVRSVTPVNEQLLAGSQVKFVASATIGTDHVDKDYLSKHGIGFANSPGCNAESVVDYVLSALINLAAETGKSLSDRVVGIVGVGNVGSRLQARLQAMGCKVLLNDPPRAEALRAGIITSDVDFESLEALVEQCDTLCLHTPLTKQGSFPSFHLFDQSMLQRLNKGSWLINAGRGGAIDNQALNQLLEQRSDLEVVLDVWENEPAINCNLFEKIRWGSPHIAGYSLEGRMRGTEMIYQAACKHLQLNAVRTLDALLPVPQLQELVLNDDDRVNQHSEDIIRRIVNLCYDLRDDDRRLRWLFNDQANQHQTTSQGFDLLRRNYPMRREFNSLTIVGTQGQGRLAKQLAAMGFYLR